MSPASSRRIVIVGAGAVGGWVGGALADTGYDITLIDPWPEHVTAIRDAGITLTEPGRRRQVPIRALHVADVQSLHKTPVDVAFICVKLYDTDWATALIVSYLSASGFVVTMQNGLIEERVAAIAGWGRTVGCVAGGLHVAMLGPAHINRNRQSGVSARKVFHVGETHGRVTPRIGFVAEMLGHVDRSEVTTNLWGARWSKLTANCMTSALCGVSGMPMPKLFADAAGRKIMTHLAAQAVTVGLALGYAVDDVFGIAAQRWVAAAAGDRDATSQAADVFQRQLESLADDASSGTAQDFARQRRSEIDYMNGYVAAKAAEIGLRVPMHAAMTELVKTMEAGLAAPGLQSLESLLSAIARD